MSFLSNLTDNNSSNLSLPTSTTVVTTVSDVVKATQILTAIDRYIQIILYITGVSGALLNIFIFLQKQLRSNPCSMYFLAASFCDLCTCNIFILTKIVSLFEQQRYLQFSRTSFWCKFSNYCVFMFPCLSSLYIACASIDRFCSSSRRARLRKVSSIKVSRVVIPLVFVIWGLFSMHTAIGFDLRKSRPTDIVLTCTPTKEVYTFFVIVDGFFFALFNGAIIPFFLALFGILIIRHVRQTRHRTFAAVPVVAVPLTGVHSIPVTTNASTVTPISRANLHLIIMLLVQVCLTIFLNLPYVIAYLNNLYHTVTVTPLYLTLVYIITWLWYSNYCKTFYVNTLSSQLFRSILKQQVLYIMHRTQTQLVVVWSSSGQR